MSGITYEEWLAALSGVAGPVDDGLTAGGWAAKLGLTRERGSKWVRMGLENGWLKQVTILVPHLGQDPRRTPGFRLVAKEGGG